jgi:glycosyltransferase involved in cell wall biosynthesis
MLAQLSVVIPTYNGAKKITKLLQKLAIQTFSDFETIIVNDGSTDNTLETIRQFNFPLKNLQVVDQINKGRAGARNSGAEIANGEILLFIDDDIVPSDDLVEIHYKAQQNHDIVVGLLESMNISGNKEVLAYAEYNNNKWNTDIHERSTEIFYITANNFSIKKKTFFDVSGFDSRLKDAEDFDLAVKLKERNYQIFYEPKATALHMLPMSFKETMKRAREYGKARDALIKLNPSVAKYYSNPSHKIAAYKKPFFYFFTFPLLIKLADKNMMTLLPKKLRFKIYDMMMTAHTIF